MSKLPNGKTVEQPAQARTNGGSKEVAPAAPLGAQTVIALQHAAGNRAVGQLLFGGNGHTEPHGNGNGNGSGYPTYFVQRKPANGAGESALEEQAERVETAIATEPAAGTTLLVEDDVQSLQPGQMHKSEFLSALKTSVCAGADEELKGTIWSTMGCPYVERWFEVYQNKESGAVERALHKYAPETRTVTSAEQYIPVVTAKVRKGVAVWKETGEVTGVPPEFAQGGMPGATFEGLVGAGLGALGGLVGKAASAIGGAISGAAQAVGSGIASIGRALFKAQPGGADEGQDSIPIQMQLQGGHPLDADVRGKMETAFGRDFSGVRVHSDAGASQLAANLNARALTVGRDMAFGAGEYQPGTLIGDALIAHELAHVVQQGNGKTQGAQTKGAAYDALEEDADVAAVSAVATQFRGAQGAPGKVGQEVMPRLRSGLQLQRCSSKKKVAQPGKDSAGAGTIKETRFKSAKLATRDLQLEETAKLLQGVNDWAQAEMHKQGINKQVGPTAVVGLDAIQLANAKKASANLTTIQSLFDATKLEPVITKLQQASDNAKGAKKYIGREELEFRNEMTLALNRADQSLDEAGTELEKARDAVDGTEFWAAIEEARGTLNSVKAGTVDQFDGLEKFAKQLKAIRDQMRAVQNDYSMYPPAIARITFVVSSFVALNAPGTPTPPTAANIKKFRGTLRGSLSADFRLLFKTGPMNQSFELFVRYADLLDRQLETLDKMQGAGTPAKGPVPTQGEAEAFFKALVKQPNQEVFDAYESYARGYFYHRIVTSIEDMQVKDVEALFKRPLSITGTRPLVCSGYAILGGHLLPMAGSTRIKFVSAVRATDADILNDTIDSGHAITHLKRKGKDFFVSNDSIVFKEVDAIGPDAVAWGNSEAPLIKASGPSNAAALEALKQVLLKKKVALESKTKGKKK